MKIVQSLVFSAALAAALLGPGAVFAQATMAHSKMGNIKMDPSMDMTDGEVRKVDQAAGKVTIKHSDIKSHDMPAMTMVFQVKDKALLDKIKTGDKIKFKIAREKGKIVVTDIQQSK